MGIEQMDGDSIVITASPRTDSLRYYGTFEVTISDTRWDSMQYGDSKMSDVGCNIRAERKVPKLEYVTENANRVWGCNSEENVIYSCRLGWNRK